MGMSLKQLYAELPEDVRRQYILDTPDYLVDEMLRGEWWWTARPEQIPPDTPWFVCLAVAGRGFGKEVCIDTMIPVCYRGGMIVSNAQIPGSGGFKKMGELQVGDWVFDETGKPCRVTGVFDDVPEIAYRLTFADGVTIDACSEHQWVTWEHRDRKAYLRSEYESDKTRFPANWPSWRARHRTKSGEIKVASDAPGPRIRTTQNIVDTLTHGARQDRNHCIPVSGELDLPEAVLPLEPWTLGYWLGNGLTKSGQVCGNLKDESHVRERLFSDGWRSGAIIKNQHRDEGYGGFLFTVYGLIRGLRAAGVLNNKHVPEQYLWASAEQRRALLAGLMDSDGYGSKSNVEFTSTRKVLAEAALHLARSLGQRPVLSEGRATLNGKDMGAKYRVNWRPTFNPFTSPRKMATYVPPDGQGLRTQHRMIVSAERIDPTPMRCITVDSPNSMYLITEAMIPTHNTRAGSEWMVDRTIKHPYDSHGVPTEWLLVAETLSDARAICVEGPAGILRVLERRKIKHQYVKSPRPQIRFPSGVKIHCEGADDPDVGRGYNAAGAWLDEICKWKYPKESWDEGIMPSLRADLVGDQPRAFVTTTPKPIKILRDWLARTDGSVHLMRGSTFDNAANLSSAVLDEMRHRYEGTIIGRQELYGEIIEAFEGALFSRLDLENHRVPEVPDEMTTVIVGVDPSLTGEDDEMGVVVVGATADRHMYVLGDESIMAVGRAAALHVWRVLERYGADLVVYENNLGKRWMATVFEDAFQESVKLGLFPPGMRPPMKPVDAKTGKRTRGEPVAMRSEQGRLHFVGRMPELEDQCSTFTSWGTAESPDRLDALVHACRWIMLNERKSAAVTSATDFSSTLKSLFADTARW